MTAAPRVLVAGGGVAGLSAAIEAARLGARPLVVSTAPSRRSGSVLSNEGIDAALSPGDSPDLHAADVLAASSLASPALVRAICAEAPGIVLSLARAGVPFTREGDGGLSLARLSGSSAARTAFAGALTGELVLHALDEEARRLESAGVLERRSGVESLCAALDERGACRGVVLRDLASGEIRAEPAQAVIAATGGPGLLLGRSALSSVASGSFAASLFRAGARFADGDLVALHPLAIPGEDKDRILPELLLAHGARILAVGAGSSPGAFLEERPRPSPAVMAREAGRFLRELSERPSSRAAGLFLDVGPMTETSRTRFRDALALAGKIAGVDPREVPIPVTPAVAAGLGGLAIPERLAPPFALATRIEGLFVAGACTASVLLGGELGGNRLLASVFTGRLAARSAALHAVESPLSPASALERERRREEERLARLARAEGPENPFVLADELGAVMQGTIGLDARTIAPEAALAKIDEIAERFRRAGPLDRSAVHNEGLALLARLEAVFDLARAVVATARARATLEGTRSLVAEFTKEGPRIAIEVSKCPRSS